MNKIDWKRKLSSRKLWAAAAGIVAGLAMVFKLDERARWTRRTSERPRGIRRIDPKGQKPSQPARKRRKAESAPSAFCRGCISGETLLYCG